MNLYQKEADKVDVKELWSIKELKYHLLRIHECKRNIYLRLEGRQRLQPNQKVAAGGDPAGGNLENRILDRRNHFLLSI